MTTKEIEYCGTFGERPAQATCRQCNEVYCFHCLRHAHSTRRRTAHIAWTAFTANPETQATATSLDRELDLINKEAAISVISTEIGLSDDPSTWSERSKVEREQLA